MRPIKLFLLLTTIILDGKLILKGSTNLLQTDSKVKASSTKIFGENTPEF